MLYETTLQPSAFSVHCEPVDGIADDAAVYLVGNKPDTPRVDKLTVEGRTLRNAMALVHGTDVASADRRKNAQALRATMIDAASASATPDDPDALIARLQRLARAGDRSLAEQLRLLARFDELKLWQQHGCRDCAMWLDRHLGISRNAALERLRVARALADLPLIESLFTIGRLSWSKVREITRVADAACEQELCATVLDLSVTETIAVCQRWHWRGTEEDGDDGEAQVAENDAAKRAFENRALHARLKDPATMRITLNLPIELGAEFMKSLECQEDQLREQDRAADERPARSAAACRADAALELARKAIAHEGDACTADDRYRVLVTVDARVLASDVTAGADGAERAARPSITGWGPIAVATARRLAAMSSLSIVALDDTDEIAGTGRSVRLCSTPMLRALSARDRCCRMPGCSNTRWLHAHHVIDWAAGGKTEPDNLALLCSSCHRAVHEGGLTLERVKSDDIELDDDTSVQRLDATRVARAKARIAQVASYRVLNQRGHVVAGPARAVRPPDPHLRRNGRGARLRLEEYWVGDKGRAPPTTGIAREEV